MHALAKVICTAGDWDDLIAVRDELRRRSRSETEAAKYRPGPHGEWMLTRGSAVSRYKFGADVFDDAVRRHAPAPAAVLNLTERVTTARVLEVAGRFIWDELDPLVKGGQLRRVLARERVARGDDLRNAGFAVSKSEPPMYLQPWEPSTYWNPPQEVVWPTINGRQHLELPPPGTDLGRDAVLDVIERIAPDLDERRSVKVRGSALQAIASLDFAVAEVAEMTLPVMLAHIAYGANSGPRGTTLLTDTGRRFAWELLGTVASSLSDLGRRSTASALQHAGERVRWIAFQAMTEEEYTNDEDDHQTLRVFFAIEDPEQNVAWAMAAEGPVWW